MKKLLLLSAVLLAGASASQAGVSVHLGFPLPPLPHIQIQPPVVIQPPVCEPPVYYGYRPGYYGYDYRPGYYGYDYRHYRPGHHGGHYNYPRHRWDENHGNHGNHGNNGHGNYGDRNRRW
jgi:hypothetical protein